MPKLDVKLLQQKAHAIRKEILEVIHRAGSGHPGGSLSSVEIMMSLYEYQLKYKAKEPKWEDRDRLIISKGHCTPVVYVTLANYGFFPKDELKGFRMYGSKLQGHVYNKVPGVEFNTGSLGHGLSVANGIALASRMQKKSYKAYCLLGDGECQEGSVWEAAMTAAHQRIDNVCAIVDSNKVQQNDKVTKIKNLEPLAEKWKSFGWEVEEIDGHDFTALEKAFSKFGKVKGKPFAIIANTLKGKGVGFMELNADWHGKAPNDDQYKQALAALK